jgi:hypothetical protein
MNDTTDIAEEPHDQITRLETRIEELADAVERCRKIGLFANVVLIGGLLWLVAGVLGYASFTPAMFGAITAVLGGLVLKGSNDSTMRQTQAALETAEASRTELIGALNLRTVSDAPQTPRWLH